jgi:hypothetical protein
MIFSSPTLFTLLPKTTKSLALLITLGIYVNLFSQNVYPATGSVVIDGGDLVLKRTSFSFGYVVRPNQAGYKKLQFAVEGGGPLEDLYVNAEQTYFIGNVGIGTATPSFPLNVVTPLADIAQFKATNANNTRIVVANNTGQVNLGIGSSLPYAYIWSNTGKFFIGGDGTDPTLFIDGMNSGTVGIGTTDTKGYRFAVNGDAIFTKVKVKAYANWPDYVFEKNYILPSLREVEKFIQLNKHLPGVPSEKEIELNGLDLGDNQATLLKKIEELTLYVIAQEKEIEALKSETKMINELRNEIATIKIHLDKLK